VKIIGKRKVEMVLREEKPRNKPRSDKENFRNWLSSRFIEKLFKEWFKEHGMEYGQKHFKILGQTRHLIRIFEKNLSDKFTYCFRIWKDRRYNELDDLFMILKEALVIKINPVPKYKKNFVVAEFNLPVLKKNIENKY